MPTDHKSLILSQRRIFIVEDNPANMAVAKMLLERHGAIVQLERWGTTLVGRLEHFAPVDLILLDLMFPDGISGYDLFDQIRAMPGFETVPVVAYSASNPSEAIPKARAKGFAAYIAKPLNYDLFAYQIEHILNGQPQWVAR